MYCFGDGARIRWNYLWNIFSIVRYYSDYSVQGTGPKRICSSQCIGDIIRRGHRLVGEERCAKVSPCLYCYIVYCYILLYIVIYCVSNIIWFVLWFFKQGGWQRFMLVHLMGVVVLDTRLDIYWWRQYTQISET